ncbi:MAG TPA: DUF3891 family protein, partial [Symbiobacteriaceae bacterium]|nr:DUF3891 family protein [Symbiobacteriaceae bacterium]
MPTLQYKEIDPADRPLVEQFRAGQEMLQQQLMAELKPEPLALWTHYRWLQAWDAMSVFLCLRLPGEGRTFEVGAMPHCPGGPEEVISIATEGDGRFTVSPWPFGVTRLDVTLPARFVPDRAYIGDQEFQAAFGGAPLEQIPLVIVPE